MNENTTTEEEKMDKERIAELRGYIANGKPGGPLTIKEIASILDALEAAQARVEAAYREGYQQRGVDEFGVNTKGSTPDVDFAWANSEAKNHES